MASYPVEQWFASIDQDHSGLLDVFELQKALALGRLTFSLKLVQAMMRLHDRDADGQINLAEFKELHTFLTNASGTFSWANDDNSGSLSQQQTKRALDHAGYRLDENAFAALFKSFDPDRHTLLTLCGALRPDPVPLPPAHIPPTATNPPTDLPPHPPTLCIWHLQD